MYRASLHSFRASGLDNASNMLYASLIIILSAIEVIRNTKVGAAINTSCCPSHIDTPGSKLLQC